MTISVVTVEFAYFDEDSNAQTQTLIVDADYMYPDLIAELFSEAKHAFGIVDADEAMLHICRVEEMEHEVLLKRAGVAL